MPIRKEKLSVGEVYHIYIHAVDGSILFRDMYDYTRMKNALWFYRGENTMLKLSEYFRILKIPGKKSEMMSEFCFHEMIVSAIAYCFMPNHMHIIVKQLENKGIERSMQRILTSYAMYYNRRYRRKGAVYGSRFQSVRLETNAQLEHVSRYIHLNPVTAYIVNKPELWPYSSYEEYRGEVNEGERLCEQEKYINMSKKEYEEFTINGIDYQRELGWIKHLLLEEL